MSPSSRLKKASRRLRRPLRRAGARSRPRERVATPARVKMAMRLSTAIRYALVVTAVWLIVTGTYFVFHNDVLTRLIGEQAKLQTVYEDRIAGLRAQIERIMRQKRLDQEQVEQRVNVLLQQQARMSLSLDAVEQKQLTTLTDLGERIDLRTRRMQSVLADLGIGVGPVFAEGATGGPFIPAKPTLQYSSAFEAQLHRVNVGRAQMDQYGRTLAAVPVRKPVIGETEMTSPFGIRKHPILKRRSIHTGIDLRGDIGEAVAATAAGKVTIARRQGGYGNMVEINHGNGLETRFAHLSQISVKVGELVHIGDTVGKIGSTGLSTGPHLHYETRVKGEAVDPQKFLRAGSNLGYN